MQELTAPIWSVQLGDYQVSRLHQFEVRAARTVHVAVASLRLPAAGVPTIEIGQGLLISQGYRESGLWSIFEGTVRRVELHGDELLITGADAMYPTVRRRLTLAFTNATPQEIVRWALAQAGVTQMQLSTRRYPALPRFVADGTLGEVLEAVSQAWGLQVDTYWMPGVGVWWGPAEESPRAAEAPALIMYGRTMLRHQVEAGGRTGVLAVGAIPIFHSQVIQVVDPRAWEGIRQVRVDRVTYRARPAEVVIEWSSLAVS